MIATSSLPAAVESLILDLEGRPEGLHRFGYCPKTHLVEYRGAGPSSPVVTAPATAASLVRLLSAFAHWEGEVQIGALRCEGLPSDVWLY